MSNEQWLDGYRWALTHLNDAGVINDAATYLAAGVNDTAVPTRTTATADPFVSDESKGADSPSAPAPAVSTTPTCNHPSPDLGRFKQDVCHACGVLVVPTPTGPEREATPPAPAVDDEPKGCPSCAAVWPCCPEDDEKPCPQAGVGHSLPCTGYHCQQRAALDTPPPAPEPREDAVANSKPAPSSAKTWRNEREDAVEALARVLPTTQAGTPRRHTARDLLAALDRGAVPGYGPTGDRAGER